MPGVELHSIENGLGLEAGCLEGCSRDVALLCELCDTEDCALRVVYPVRCEQTGESCDENASTVVLYACSQITDLVRMCDETHVVHHKLDCGQ